MIISASRRTDIPALYSKWFISRVRQGHCAVPNPYRKTQISTVPLTPDSVDCFVFWSKNPAPMLRYIPELNSYGHRYYFQFTLNGYPREIEAHVPPVERLVTIFRRLADTVGPERVIWRYDPIMISALTDFCYHKERFAWLASQLEGYTRRVVVSVFDSYPFVARRLNRLENKALQVIVTPQQDTAFGGMMRSIANSAQERNMEITSCAEEIDLHPYGIEPGSCIDSRLIAELFGIQVGSVKDKGQRPVCGCAKSRDIGTYGTCKLGCIYCYGTRHG